MINRSMLHLQNRRFLILGITCLGSLSLVIAASIMPGSGPARSRGDAPLPTAPASASPLSAVVDYQPLLQKSPGSAPEGMIWIPGGTFAMGSPEGAPDERPVHEVALDGFWMDRTEVTNAQFQKFVEATGHVTVAEKPPTLDDVRDSPRFRDAKILEEYQRPGSLCFHKPAGAALDPAKGAYNWWAYIPGADWRHPEGPDSSITQKLDHPVVHVAWSDAMAYCRWAGKSLPTEAQWEYAARGGLDQKRYPWGNELQPDEAWRVNIWQGEFPHDNQVEDGFTTTAPVGRFPPNAFGLCDISGNVWEWCADNYQANYYQFSPSRNPPGPGSSFDPDEPDVAKRVQRGGSFLCSAVYCTGYRVSARMKGEQESGTMHCGFRCVKNAVEPSPQK